MSSEELRNEESTSEDCVILLPVSLTIQEVEHLHAKWLPQITEKGDVVIDAGQTQQVDGAGLQLLLSLVRDLVGRGRQVSWTGVSSKVFDVVTILGMNSALGTE